MIDLRSVSAKLRRFRFRCRYFRFDPAFWVVVAEGNTDGSKECCYNDPLKKQSKIKIYSVTIRILIHRFHSWALSELELRKFSRRSTDVVGLAEERLLVELEAYRRNLLNVVVLRCFVSKTYFD